MTGIKAGLVLSQVDCLGGSAFAQSYDYETLFNQRRERIDTVAKEYAEAFFGEHRKKLKNWEIRHKFAQEIVAKATSF